MLKFVSGFIVLVLLFFIFLILSVRRDNAKKEEKIIKEVIDESERNRLASSVKELDQIINKNI